MAPQFEMFEASGRFPALPRRGRTTSRRTSVALVIGACLSVACAAPKVDLRPTKREYAPEDYHATFRYWTRQERLNTFEPLDNVLTVSGTYESSEFRRAYATRYAADYGLDEGDKAALFARLEAEITDHHEFFVALFGTVPEYGDLTRKEPAWVVRLVDDQGTETPPTDIVRVKDVSAAVTTYYPSVSSWRTAFRIRFPKRRADGKETMNQATGWFGLRFTGPQGNTTVVWEVER